MRIPFIAANWKMYKTVPEAVAYLKTFTELVKDITDVEVVVAPPFTALYAAAEMAKHTNVGVSAQDLHWEREGAFTSGISAAMVKDTGAEYVIIGHSERRRVFGDTDEAVNKKLMAALAADLTPIVCVGETLEERDGGQMMAVLDRQVREGLKGLSADQVAAIVIAYEPVWAIGTGRNATPAQAGEAHAAIRARLAEWWSADAAAQCHILYGGSVKPDNVKDLMALPDVDGALVGGASLDPQSFFKIVQGARS
jgi:triosephosphate isomerase